MTQMILDHPLFPLLHTVFQKCELATSSPRDAETICSSESFSLDIEEFIKQSRIKNIPLTTGVHDVDKFMLKSIEVLRIHLLELEKVHQLCDNFCQRYINCLKGKLPIDLVVDDGSSSASSNNNTNTSNNNNNNNNESSNNNNTSSAPQNGNQSSDNIEQATSHNHHNNGGTTATTPTTPAASAATSTSISASTSTTNHQAALAAAHGAYDTTGYNPYAAYGIHSAPQYHSSSTTTTSTTTTNNNNSHYPHHYHHHHSADNNTTNHQHHHSATATNNHLHHSANSNNNHLHHNATSINNNNNTSSHLHHRDLAASSGSSSASSIKLEGGGAGANQYEANNAVLASDRQQLHDDVRSPTGSTGSFLGDASLGSGDGTECEEDDNRSRRQQKKRGIFPKTATNIMRNWLFQHLNHPYPSEDQKKQLSEETGLTILQVNNWFINARRRIVQPMIDQSNRSSGNLMAGPAYSPDAGMGYMLDGSQPFRSLPGVDSTGMGPLASHAAMTSAMGAYSAASAQHLSQYGRSQQQHAAMLGLSTPPTGPHMMSAHPTLPPHEYY